MMRLWLKFREGADGNKVIEKATFQGFGCETALAVASVATELLAGKTVAQAREMGGVELAAPLGPLPPMKIHCATLVEEALRQALDGSSAPAARSPGDPGLVGEMAKREQLGASKIVFLKPNEGSST
jgi:NifU-like protein involved in Fe-S cluster formation